MIKVSEPKFKQAPTRMDLEIAYNDYFLDYTVSDSKKFLLAYLKNNDYNKEAFLISKIDDWKIGSVGFTARMITNGCVLPQDELESMNRKIKELTGP